MQVQLESPDQPDVLALIAELDAYQRSLYPPESCHLLDLSSLMQPHVLFAVARDAQGQALGCGAVVLQADATGELKRMVVAPAARQQGVAGQVLAELQAQARRRGCGLLRLETGPYQHAALAFYEREGFARCGRFGDYLDDPFSVFMEKRLSAPGESDLGVLLATMDPVLQPGRFVFAALPDVPAEVQATLLQAAVSTVREVEGLSLVLPEDVARQHGLDACLRCAWITLTVHSDLQAVGLTAAVSTALAGAGIACNVVAGLRHDHLFVPADQASAALAVLRALQGAGPAG